MRHRRKSIDKSITKVNTTPSRVDISDSTAVIHRIPLKLYAKDLLRSPILFWFPGLIFGALLTQYVIDPFKVVYVDGTAILPNVSGWIGLSMGTLLLHMLLLLWFVLRYRPIRIRIHAGTFYFDSWSGVKLTGKVSTKLELVFSDRFLEEGYVAMDIQVDTYEVLIMARREAYRLKLDDALKLKAFAKANKLRVGLTQEISRLKKKFEQPRER